MTQGRSQCLGIPARHHDAGATGQEFHGVGKGGGDHGSPGGDRIDQDAGGDLVRRVVGEHHHRRSVDELSQCRQAAVAGVEGHLPVEAAPAERCSRASSTSITDAPSCPAYRPYSCWTTATSARLRARTACAEGTRSASDSSATTRRSPLASEPPTWTILTWLPPSSRPPQSAAENVATPHGVGGKLDSIAKALAPRRVDGSPTRSAAPGRM